MKETKELQDAVSAEFRETFFSDQTALSLEFIQSLFLPQAALTGGGRGR